MKEITRDDIGKKVVFNSDYKHYTNPEFYPKVGTIGTIYDVDNRGVYVNWASNSTSSDDKWAVNSNEIELIETKNNDNNITDEEIVKMFLPKFQKNGLDVPFFCYSKTIIKIIALVYRSGYTRGRKGRPFKIQPKKVKSECK